MRHSGHLTTLYGLAFSAIILRQVLQTVCAQAIIMGVVSVKGSKQMGHRAPMLSMQADVLIRLSRGKFSTAKSDRA